MGRRRVGLILLANAGLLWLTMMAVAPLPTSTYAFEERVQAQGSLEVTRSHMSVAEARVHVYDAANDTSFGASFLAMAHFPPGLDA